MSEARPAEVRRPIAPRVVLPVAAIVGLLLVGVAVRVASSPSASKAVAAIPAAEPPRRAPSADRAHPPAPATDVTTVAEATVAAVRVFDRPSTTRRPRAIITRQSPDTPLIFVVRARRRSWLSVYLPVRPNGSTGWIRRAGVHLTQHRYRIVVDLHAHRITVLRGAAVIDREPIGVGTSATPTPGGHYYTDALFQPPDPRGFYGPYAYGLSGFSNVLPSFAGGPGIIGIHGTNDPAGLGRDVSHGCIRMSNAGITLLARTLPLGVPVDIRA